MARPPLPRYRADLVVAVEFSATDEEAAEARLAELTNRLRPRLTAAVRGARVGASEAIAVTDLANPSAV